MSILDINQAERDESLHRKLEEYEAQLKVCFILFEKLEEDDMKITLQCGHTITTVLRSMLQE